MSYFPDERPGMIELNTAFCRFHLMPITAPRASPSAASHPTILPWTLASLGAYSASTATFNEPLDRIAAGTSAATAGSLVAPKVWVAGNGLLKFRWPAPHPLLPPPPPP